MLAPHRLQVSRPLLDLAALATSVWLGSALLFWSGWSASFWARPEQVVLFLLGIGTLRSLVAPIAIPAVEPRVIVAVGVTLYALILSFVTVTHHLPFRTHALGRRRWLAGVATALGAFTLLAVEVRWIIPHFRHEPYAHLGRYAALGQSLGQIVLTVVVHPFRTLGGLLTRGRLVYLVALLAPLGLLLGGRDIVGALPALAENLLSSDPVLYNYRAQYQAFLLPFIFLAAIAGYARLTAWRTSRWARLPLGGGVRVEPRAGVPSGQ